MNHLQEAKGAIKVLLALGGEEGAGNPIATIISTMVISSHALIAIAEQLEKMNFHLNETNNLLEDK
jgi:hypothetical protein